MPEDSPDEIAAKRRRFEDGRTDPGLWALQTIHQCGQGILSSIKKM
jgi:hypothetical protein